LEEFRDSLNFVSISRLVFCVGFVPGGGGVPVQVETGSGNIEIQ